jgi:Zn-dependent protease with chaperone function
VGARAGRLGRDGWRARATVRDLTQLASVEPASGLRVLPLDEPQAFVLGALAPEVFVTRGLLSPAHRAHLDAVLAHEQAHVRRRDPLRRAVASLASSFHLPGVARGLERRLWRAHEMAADAEAARTVGSAPRIADALVQLTRAHRSGRGMAVAGLAFGESDVEVRVLALLDERPRHDRPGPSSLLCAAVALFVATSAAADHVHHGVEILLGLLGG